MKNNKCIKIPSNYWGYYIHKKDYKDPLTQCIKGFIDLYLKLKKKNTIIFIKDFVIVEKDDTIGWKCTLIPNKISHV